ncbi:aldo/keto reductase [Hyphomicrobium sp. MC8b]|uniref:aldo/keto reductase n=1 Tax=Hyphomicrobium sp. MC8b TaxID=300273 RepID=UPI003918CCDE
MVRSRCALAWLQSKPVATSVIVGAKRLNQLADNISAIDVRLSGEEIRKLDEVSEPPPEYPGSMLATHSATVWVLSICGVTISSRPNPTSKMPSTKALPARAEIGRRPPASRTPPRKTARR